VYTDFIDYQKSMVISNQITAITGITGKMLSTYGASPIDVCEDLRTIFSCADFIVAHNGNEFDKPWLEKFVTDYGYYAHSKSVGDLLPDKTWIDTIIDIDYPEHCASRNLTYLQAFHGVVMPMQHRALFDVFTMFLILQQYKLDDIIELAKSPSVWVEALVDYDNRNLAKSQGFGWKQPEGFNKSHWLKRVKEIRLHNEVYPEFKVKVYNGTE